MRDTAIYTEIFKINQKIKCEKSDRLTKLLANAPLTDQDADLIVDWLKDINKLICKESK